MATYRNINFTVGHLSRLSSRFSHVEIAFWDRSHGCCSVVFLNLKTINHRFQKTILYIRNPYSVYYVMWVKTIHFAVFILFYPEIMRILLFWHIIPYYTRRVQSSSNFRSTRYSNVLRNVYKSQLLTKKYTTNNRPQRWNRGDFFSVCSQNSNNKKKKSFRLHN